MDEFEGGSVDPASLHKYLYTQSEPINQIDPSGDFTLVQQVQVAVVTTVLANLAITGLALGQIASTGPTPDGVIVSGRITASGRGFTAGGGIDLYYDLHTRQFWYAFTAELGTFPLSIFKNYRGLGLAFTVGAAWGNGPAVFSGLSFNAVWPRRAFGTAIGAAFGKYEAFATLIRLATLTNSVKFKDWAAVFGFSPASGSYFQIGPRSNSFASLVSYSNDYRLLSHEIRNSLGELRAAISTIESTLANGISDEKYLALLDSLNPF
jgi:hypothetical protein